MADVASLSVRIGADTADLKKKLKTMQTDLRGAFAPDPVRELTKALTGATGSLSNFASKAAALSAMAAGGFGLKTLIGGAVESGANLYELSQRLGITTADAGKFSKILKFTGSDVDSFASAMGKLNKTYITGGEASEKIKRILSAFDVTLTSSTGKLLPLNNQVEQLAKGFKLASTAGVEQEFILSTLGAKGMALIPMLRDYENAVKRTAALKGIGIDPAQMKELSDQMKIVSMQAGSLGAAFATALAPVAQQYFPPIMSGLSNTAKFLAENKDLISSNVTGILKVAVAYKTLGAAKNVLGGIGAAWQAAEAQSIKAALAAIDAERKMEMAASEFSAAKVNALEKGIAAEKATATARITEEKRVLAFSKAANAERIASEQQTTMAILNAQKLRAEAELLTIRAKKAATAEIKAVEAASLAAKISYEKEATAATLEASAKSAAGQKVIQKELAQTATAHGIAGNAAAAHGAKTVGAMATAGVAVRNFGSMLLALAGGWVGVGIAAAFAANEAYKYFSMKAPSGAQFQDIEGYGGGAKLYQDPKTQRIYKDGEREIKETLEDELGLQYEITRTIKDRIELSEQEYKALYKAQAEREKGFQLPETPQIDLGLFASPEKPDKGAAAAADKLAREIDRVNEKLAEMKDRAREAGFEFERFKVGQIFGDLEGSAAVFGNIMKSGIDAYNTLSNEVKKFSDLQIEAQKLYERAVKAGNAEQIASTKAAVDKAAQDTINAKEYAERRTKELDDKITEKLKSNSTILTAFKTDLDENYREGNLAGYMEALSAEKVAFMSHMSETQALMQQQHDWRMEAAQTFQTFQLDAMNTIKNGLAESLANAVTEGENLGRAIQNIGKQIVNMFIQWQVKRLAAAALSNSLSMKETAAVTAQGSAMAAALAPAAWSKLVVNPGAGPIASALLAEGLASAAVLGAVPIAKASGGLIRGPGTGTSDSIPARLSDGEYVMQNSAVRQFGSRFFDALNSGQMPVFAGGGIVTRPVISHVNRQFDIDDDLFPTRGVDNRFPDAEGETVIAVNIYGDINTGQDYNSLMSDINWAVRAARR